MTRKHFKAIADVLAGELALCSADGPDFFRVRRIIYSMADVCKQSNIHFNRDKFYAACGLTVG